VSLIKLGATVLFCAVLLGGCFPGSKPPYVVHFYSIEYPSAVPTGLTMKEAVRIGRFSVVQSYNTSTMFYRPEPYKVAGYSYHRWRTNPGDMVTEHLLEDFRSSGLFHAVFSYRHPENVRFVVDGDVEEFLEAKAGDGWEAALSIEVSLRDTAAHEMGKEILFQKRYRTVEPLTRESPEEFARGMSRAMARVSGEILGDIYTAVKARADDGRSLH
jgi:ABC-type uncharacterized transport system auxiliary subunit